MTPHVMNVTVLREFDIPDGLRGVQVLLPGLMSLKHFARIALHPFWWDPNDYYDYLFTNSEPKSAAVVGRPLGVVPIPAQDVIHDTESEGSGNEMYDAQAVAGLEKSNFNNENYTTR